MNRPLKSPASAPASSKAVRVFVSYSHEDYVWLQRLTPLLKGLRGAEAKTFTDKDIRPGDNWDKAIRDALDGMDVFVALVSVNFGTSDYIREVELPRAKKRLAANEIDVLPVYLGAPSKGDAEWLMKLERVPWEKSWAEIRGAFPEYDHALKPIRDGIKAVVERARARKNGR